MPTKIKFPCLFLIALCLVAGCKGYADKKANDVNSVSKEGHPAYLFKLSLPVNSKYACSINNKTTTRLEMNRQEFDSENESNFGLQYEVLFASPDSTVLKATYQKFHIEIKTGDTRQVTDADNAAESQDVIEKLLSNIKGSSLLITLNNKGKVKSVTGADAITEKVLAGLSFYDEPTKQKVKAEIIKFVGNDFIKNNIESGFNLFPDSTITEGSTWQLKNAQPGEINFESQTTYTLSSLDDGIATINAVSQVSTGNKTSLIMNQQVNAAIKGESKDVYKVNMSTGMLAESNSKSTLAGTVQISGKEIPIEITTQKKVTIKKI